MLFRRLSIALRAGLAAYAAGILLCALAATPLIASDNFGHSHSETAPVHVHPITQLLPIDTILARQQVGIVWVVVAFLALIGAVRAPIKPVCGKRRCRAPPVLA